MPLRSVCTPPSYVPLLIAYTAVLSVCPELFAGRPNDRQDFG